MIDEICFAAPIQLQSVAFISDEARGLAATSQHSEAAPFLADLLERGMQQDALWILPYMMSVRKGIWWSCLCSWHACGGNPSPAEDHAFQAIVDWIRSPSVDTGAKAAAAVDDDDLKSSLGCCCHAVRMVGSAANDRRMLPGIAKLIGHSARLALQLAECRGVSASARQLARFGLDVAANKATWI